MGPNSDNDLIAMWQAGGPLAVSTLDTGLRDPEASIHIVHCSADRQSLRVTPRTKSGWVADHEFGFRGDASKNYTALAVNDFGAVIEEWAVADDRATFNFVNFVNTTIDD